MFLALSFSTVYSILLIIFHRGYGYEDSLMLRQVRSAHYFNVRQDGTLAPLRKCRDSMQQCVRTHVRFCKLAPADLHVDRHLADSAQACCQRTCFGKSNRLEGSSGEKGWRAACLPPSYRMMRVTIEQRLDFEPLLQCNSAPR